MLQELYAKIGLDGGELDLSIHQLIDRLYRKTPNVKCGRNRMVFVSKNYVIKIPMCWDGVADNDWEGSVSNSKENIDDPEYVQYAKTRLVYLKGVPIVFMERVIFANNTQIEEYLGLDKGSSNWTWSVDCGQVGFNKKGRLVAFDYGIR